MTSQGIHVKTAFALVAGAAAVGAGVGLLYSPQSGADTRREIGRYAKKTQVEATRLSRSFKTNVDKAVQYGKTNVDKAVQYGKSMLPKKENGSSKAAA